jgi:ribonuclease HI
MGILAHGKIRSMSTNTNWQETKHGLYKQFVFHDFNEAWNFMQRGNPGPSASGYVLLDMSNNVVLQAGEFLGVTTNNQAEYQALKLGLEHAIHDFHAREIHVYMDSMLVVNQMKGIFKIKNRDLWPVHNACVELVHQLEKVSFDHVPRELNKLADEQVNEALDNALQGQQ